MDIRIYLILAAFIIQSGYILYRDYKDRNRKRTKVEIFIEVLSILIGAYFNYGFSVFTNYLTAFIWAFIAGFILDLWFRAEIIVRIGKWYRARLNK